MPNFTPYQTTQFEPFAPAALTAERLYRLLLRLGLSAPRLRPRPAARTGGRGIVDRKALEAAAKEPVAFYEMTANRASRFTQLRQTRKPSYVPRLLDLTECETRKLYIDAMLQDAGWTEGRDWLNEYPVEGMTNQSGKGLVDYILLGDDGRPLALVEAKRTCKDPAAGRQQAKRAFVNLLPDLSLTNLCEGRENLTARAVFSTYQTMMGCIDEA